MSWITAQVNPEKPRPLQHFRLFAVLGTWMEADVVDATIRNAMMQGCERVYLVDNDSLDDTVDRAVRAGGILARSFKTDQYDEELRHRHMNAVVEEISRAERDDHIWWLFLDADEFHHGPWGMTLAEYLNTLDAQFRVVGARFFDHYPSESPHYLPGRHPLDFQPLCEELAVAMCPSRHRKHPLLRYDRMAARIEADRGFHLVRCSDPISEPAQPVFIHHFPFRDKETTRRRLEALWAKRNDGSARAVESSDTCTHMWARFRSLEAVYAGKWAAVHNFLALDPMYMSLPEPPAPMGVTVKPWTDLVQPEHQVVRRW